MNNNINIAELLKDCPKGMELDCTMYEDVTLISVLDGLAYPIRIETPDRLVLLTEYGCYSRNEHAKCIIFPKGKTTWEGFVPPCQFKDGDIVHVDCGDIDKYIAIFKQITINDTVRVYSLYDIQYDRFHIHENLCEASTSEIRLATEEEKAKLFKVIKDNGYRWNAETKTLEKLIEPKFKVGDKVKGKYTNNIYTISGITPTGYKLTNGQSFDFHAENCHELVSNKFDITILKPFESRVLVRDGNNDEWRGHFFSHHYKGSDRPYICIGQEGLSEYRFCIPFEGNEHLLGKTEDCEEFYKTWKDETDE